MVKRVVLTGESVPLMKEAVQPDTKDKEEERRLAFDGRDGYTLFWHANRERWSLGWALRR